MSGIIINKSIEPDGDKQFVCIITEVPFYYTIQIIVKYVELSQPKDIIVYQNWTLD